MQPRESKREISREKFDAVLLDLDGVITDTAINDSIQRGVDFLIEGMKADTSDTRRSQDMQ